MNIDEITSKRQGWQSNPNANVAAGSVPYPSWPSYTPTGEQFAGVVGHEPTKPCAHDFAFLRERVEAGGYCQFDVFFCRRCLEKREVKR